MKKVLLALSFVMAFGLSAIFAQTRTITGTVTGSDDGMPVPGASVFVKGTTVGTVTQGNGTYSISVPQDAQTLVVSFVGMQTQEVAIAGKSVINVALASSAIAMDEVVVTGYSTRKKDVVASAVTIVSGDNLKKLSPSTSLDNMLQGKAAGVDVTSLNGKPGQTATIKVRGAVSLNAVGGDKAQPLYVVDGVFMNELHLSTINPSDIETITILKDASASSIYGSRGANGVIVITTKKGKKGEGKIEYTGRFGSGKKIEDRFEMMNAAERIQYNEAIRSAQGLTPPYTNEQKNLLLGYDHNWQDDILRTAKIESHNLSFNGGSDKSTYFISGGYDSNTGIITKLHGYERVSGRVNIDSEVKKYLKVGANVSFAHINTDESRDRNNVQNPFRAMYEYQPFEPVYRRDATGAIVYDALGNPIYNVGVSGGLPILEALGKNPETQKQTMFIGSFYADYQIIEGLNFLTRYSGNFRKYKREAYTMPSSVLNGFVGDPLAPGSKTDNGNDNYTYSWLNQLSYKNSIGLNNFNVSAFTEFSENNFHSYSLSSKGYASDLLNTQDNGAEPTAASTSKSAWAMFSIAGLIEYDYDGKYLSSFSLRQDGGSRFGKDNKKGIFWSGSLGWNIAKEDFLTSLVWIDDLKLSVSYGTLGSWNIPNYASQGYYSFGAYDSQSAGIIRSNVANPDLTWETQKSTNFGIETAMLDKRLTATMDYFINNRTDFLFDNPLTWESGGYTQFINAGEMVTKGLELSLGYDLLKLSDLRWNVGMNVSFLDYEIKKLNNQPQIVVDGISILKPGETPFTFYLPRYAGVNPENGDAQYLDKDGILTTTFSSGNSVVLSGKSPLPTTFGGFNTNIMYKGFDLAADFSFKTGNYTYNYMAWNMLTDGMNETRNQRKDALDYWKQAGDNKLPRLRQNSNQTTDRFLQDASYLRFRSLTLGYTLPSAWVSKAKVDNLRLYVQAQNLYTWTNFEGDPEVSIGSGESQLGANQTFIPGLYSLYSYPTVQTILFGIDLRF